MRQGEKGGQRSSEGRRDEHTGEELGSVQNQQIRRKEKNKVGERKEKSDEVKTKMKKVEEKINEQIKKMQLNQQKRSRLINTRITRKDNKREKQRDKP